MLVKTKINYKKYLILSIIVFLLSAFFLKTSKEYLATFIVFIAALINQLILIEIVFQLLNSRLAESKVSGLKLAFLFILKIGIIFGALSFGVHLMGNRIIIPVINYCIQIFVLIFSVKRQEVV